MSFSSHKLPQQNSVFFKKNIDMKYLLLIISFALLQACITETESEETFRVIYKNEASVACRIVGFEGNTIKAFDRELTTGETYTNCDYRAGMFVGDLCLDSIAFIFPNGKGYACDVRVNNIAREFCFSNTRSPLVGEEGFRDLGDNTLQFTITEDDYLNAKDLD